MIRILQHFIADEITAMYEKIGSEIDSQVQAFRNTAAASSFPQLVSSLQRLLDVLKTSSQSRDITVTALSALQKVRWLVSYYYRDIFQLCGLLF